jgi:hypothetical protein
MELFLPGIIVILLAAFFVFLVVPRVGSTILVVTSILALGAAAYNHLSMFSNEYKLSTWQLNLASSGPWVVLLLAFLFLIGAIQWIYSGSAANAAPSPLESLGASVSNSFSTMPPANTATNPVTAAINSGINSLKSLTRTNNRNASPLIPGLNFKASSL